MNNNRWLISTITISMVVVIALCVVWLVLWLTGGWYSLSWRFSFTPTSSTVTSAQVQDRYFAVPDLVRLPYTVNTSGWRTLSTASYEIQYPASWGANLDTDVTPSNSRANASGVNLLVPNNSFNTRLGIQIECESVDPVSGCDSLNPGWLSAGQPVGGLAKLWNIPYDSTWGNQILDNRVTVLDGISASFEKIAYIQRNIDAELGTQTGFNGHLELMVIYTLSAKNGRAFKLTLVSGANSQLSPQQVDDFMKIASTFKIK